jgi:hypothetical protein
VTVAPIRLALALGAAFALGLVQSDGCGYEPEERRRQGEPCTRSSECELGLECRGGVCMPDAPADAGRPRDAGPDGSVDAAAPRDAAPSHAEAGAGADAATDGAVDGAVDGLVDGAVAGDAATADAEAGAPADGGRDGSVDGG